MIRRRRLLETRAGRGLYKTTDPEFGTWTSWGSRWLRSTQATRQTACRARPPRSLAACTGIPLPNPSASVVGKWTSYSRRRGGARAGGEREG